MGNEIPGVGSRREAREEALAVLYAADVGNDAVVDVLATRDAETGEYAIAIVEGVGEDLDEIDATIGRHLTGWRIERMAALDRTIARIATWELQARLDVPTGVVLSEAVEIATLYCGEQSPRFLNGVLKAVAEEIRTD